MSGIRSVLSTTAIFVGGGVALLTGGIAKADPAPPAPAPSVPGLAVVEQIADPSKAPQLLQAASSILSGNPATPAVPATPPPVASASVNLPQQALPTLPGTNPALPATTPTLPGANPALPATAPTLPGTTEAAPTQPGAELTLPQVPGLPVPLPQRVSFPGDLVNLLPVGAAPAMNPAQAAAAAAGAPAAASPMTAPTLASLFPTNALP